MNRPENERDPGKSSEQGRQPPGREEIKRRFDEEFAVPGSGSGLHVDPNEIHEVSGDPNYFLDYSREGIEPDRSDHPAAKWVWVRRPWYIWLPCLVLGISLLLGSFRTAGLLAAAGLNLVDRGGNDWSGGLRLLLTLIGLIVLAVAAPEKRPEHWSEAGQRQLEQDREYFHRKKFGNRPE